LGETGERERSWALHLFLEWEWFNTNFLKGALRAPVLEISHHEARLGHWDPATRTLAISARHIERDPWLAVIETLRHEMAHQYAHEVLGGTREAAHGPAFQRACEALRVSQAASGTGMQDADDPVARERRRVLSRVEKLLALGASPNTHEAELAVARARQLLLEHNLSELDLVERKFEVRRIGRMTQRKHLYEALLANVLLEFFFVQSIWVGTYDARKDKKGKVLEIHGTRTNLELAEYVHDYVSGLLPGLWERHKQARGLTSNRRRLEFYAGVVSGFETTLRRQNAELEERALVWKGDPALDSHFRWCYPRTETTSYGSGARGQTYVDGIAEGERVRIRKPIREGKPTFGGLLGRGG
jgi:hypothetical protein